MKNLKFCSKHRLQYIISIARKTFRLIPCWVISKGKKALVVSSDKYDVLVSETKKKRNWFYSNKIKEHLVNGLFAFLKTREREN